MGLPEFCIPHRLASLSLKSGWAIHPTRFGSWEWKYSYSVLNFTSEYLYYTEKNPCQSANCPFGLLEDPFSVINVHGY